MTKQEVAKLIAIVRTNYTRFFRDMSQQDLKEMISGWEFTLQDLTYEQASIGLRVFMTGDSHGFPPSPGQIVQCYRKTLKNPEEDSMAAEAWEQVWRAISNVRWEDPSIEYNKLPKVTQRIIGSPSSLAEMSRMDTESVLVAEKGRFIKEYNSYMQRSEDFAMIPKQIRDRLEQKSEPQAAIESKVETETVVQEEKPREFNPEISAKMEELKRRLGYL